VLDRLNAGADVVEVMQEVRTGKLASGARPGSIPWSPRGSLAPSFGDEFERHAFDTPAGGHSDLFAGKDGRYFIVFVTGRKTRELDPFALQFRKDTLFQKWLDERIKAVVTRSPDWESLIPTDPVLPPELAATPRPPAHGP